MSDFNGAWKETMDAFLPVFLRFFFPEIYADIDWARDVQSMEQEFRSTMQPGLGNKVICDKLILCRSLSRTDPLLLHFEVNCYRDDEYPVRLLRYVALRPSRARSEPPGERSKRTATLLALGTLTSLGLRPRCVRGSEDGARTRLHPPCRWSNCSAGRGRMPNYWRTPTPWLWSCWHT